VLTHQISIISFIFLKIYLRSAEHFI